MRDSRGLFNWKKCIILFAVLMLTMGAASVVTNSQEVQAASLRVVKKNGKIYGYDGNKQIKKKWAKIDGYYYYFKAGGAALTNSFKTTKYKNTYYLDSNGKNVYGWKEIKDSTGYTNWFYFNNKGRMQVGFLEVDGKRYYMRTTNRPTGARGSAIVGGLFNATDGHMYWAASKSKKGAFKKGFYDNTKNGYRYYFTAKSGLQKKKWITVSGKTYRAGSKGRLLTAWHTISNADYYFLPSGDSKYQRVENTSLTMDGYIYKFASDGKCTEKTAVGGTSPVVPTSAKTIKNFLANALKPVGSTLYIWGGGHDDGDATRKGVNSQWAKFFKNHAGPSYNYNNYRFAYGKGLDCSGYVGWSIYQIMESKSGGNWYTEVSGGVGSLAVSRGYGKTYTWNALEGNHKAGDIGYDDNHTWIVLGQCSDKSLVILHSTPPGGVQIAGSPTPDGNYSSKAITLAQKYMKKYYPDFCSKFPSLGFSTGNYARRGRYMRFNSTSKGLTDPDGFKKMSANQILKALLGSV